MIKGQGSTSPVIRAWESLDRDPLVDVRQIATVLNVDVSSVRRWITAKKLRAHRIGGKLRVRTSAVLQFMGEDGHE